MTIVDAGPKPGQVEAAQLLFQEARQRRRKRWIVFGVVAVALVVLASAITALTVLTGSPSTQHVSRAPTPVAPLPMGTALTWGPPVQLTSGEGSLWVTHGAPSPLHTVPSPIGSGGVVRIAVGTATAQPWAQIASPDSSAVFDGSLWTAGFNTGFVTRIDTRTGKVLAQVVLPPPPPAYSPFPYSDGLFLPDSIAASQSAIWIISTRGYAAEIDPSSNQVTHYFRLAQEGPRSVVADNQGAWVAEGLVGIAHLSSTSKVNVVPVLVGGQPGNVDDVLLARGSLWATGTLGNGLSSPYEGFIARLDPSTGTTIAIRILSEPVQLLAKTKTAIWTTSGQDLFLVRPNGAHGLSVLDVRNLGIRNGIYSLTGAGNRLWFIASKNHVVTGLNPFTGATVKVHL
jgi:hypothetical protein